MEKLVITYLSLCVNGIKSCVSFFFLIEEGTAGDETRSDNIKKSDEQQELAEDEIQEESESLLDAINKITLIKSC
jgi:hypothetical protein